MKTIEIIRPEYKLPREDSFSVLHYFCKKIFLSIFFCSILSIIGSVSLHASGSKKFYGFTILNLQEDTVARPMQAAVLSDTAREYILEPGESSAEKIRKNLFVRAYADKAVCYVGEPVIINYKLYSRLVAKSKISKQPALNGFSVYDMIDFASNAESTELIQNRPFKVYTLRKAQLIPLQNGTMQLDPIEVDNSIHFIRSLSRGSTNANSLQDLVNQLSKEESSPSADMSIKIQSKPVKIVVIPFPEINRPTDFNGAVGRFKIQAVITTKNLTVNDAGILKVEIKGRGNVSLIDAPIVKWPAGIDTLDIRFNEKIDKTVAPLSGIKTFEYIFTPLKEGSYKIPPISFSFFNTASHSYQTILTKSNIFEVAHGNKRPIRKEMVDSALSVKKNNSVIRTVANYVKGQLIWILVVSVLLILSIYLWQKNKRLQKKREPEITNIIPGVNSVDKKQPEFPEQAIDILSDSRTLLEKGDYKGFYVELNHVLWDELTIKLNLALTELNKPNIEQGLKQKGWTDEMTNRLDSVLIKCERSIYLPDYHQETDATTILKIVQQLVLDLKNT